MSRDGPSACVGLLRLDAVGAAHDDARFLSPAEQLHVGRIRHARRRNESVMARAVAKYLLLAGTAPSTAVTSVGAAELVSIPASAYRGLSILPGRDGAPAMHRGGSRAVAGVSLSHAGGTVSAALVRDGAVGIDYEIVQARVPAFFRHHFAPAERAWVGQQAACFGADWLYTLLWSVKEAALKTGRLGVQALASVAVRAQALPAASLRAAPSPDLQRLAWQIQGLAPDLAFTALPGGVLTVVHFPGVDRRA